ncbi:MAG: hypothetical protein M3Y86_07205 [Verrucomicrobiota bacterium]|nr:hypothetical protein [Verrucomicrobiota bacterium]
MIFRTSKIRFATAALALAAALAGQAKASVMTYQPTPVDLNDLDHHSVYTWRIDNISLNGGNISSASLTFTNIANWDSNANVLHLWLLDTAKSAGVASFIDDPSNTSPVTDLTDDFKDPRFHSDPGWLVANGTAQTFLADKSFTTTPGTYTLNFTASELATLTQYISQGKDIAFGIDPDCHFFNDGVSFTMNVTPVPEMSALFPIVGLIVAVSSTHVLRRRRLARVTDRLS